MHKRQALGTLNQNGHALTVPTAAAINALVIKQTNAATTAIATASFKSFLPSSSSSSSSSATNNTDLLVNNENKPPNVNDSHAKTDLENVAPLLRDEVKPLVKQHDVVEDEEDDDENDEEYEEEDEDEEEEEEEESDDDDEEDENEDDEDAGDEDDFRNQFKDISRLNGAASLSLDERDYDSQDKTDIMNVVMLDTSLSALNNTSLTAANNISSNEGSPMILDETIKFSSKIEFSEEEEEVEDEEAVSTDDDPLDKYEETDVDTRKRLAHEEREDCLKNCFEYKDDILAYMRELEKTNRPKANYMRKQTDITSNMRSILVDWLVEVSEEYRLHPETLYLAVNYTDRFLSQMSVLRGKLQLVGTASMYIAAKYEEITPPDVSEFVFITDDTYTKKQVLRMEHLLFKCLDFRMSSPTAQWFLTHYMRFIKLSTSLRTAANADLCQRIESLARYLCELTLIDGDTYMGYLPSQVAASAIYLSLYTLGRPWTKQIAEQLGYAYDLNELKACICDMYKTMQEAPTHAHQAIQEKYKQPKFDYASLIDPPKSLPAHLTKTNSSSSSSSQ
jgi:cyclin-A